MEPVLVLNAQAILGEGAIWNEKTRQLFWVDIEGKKLHCYHPDNRATCSITVDDRIGTVVLSRGSQQKAIVAMQSGIYELDLTDESTTFLGNPLEGMEQMRFNDGKCDPAGRFWVGSMHLESEPEVASLYRMETDGSIVRVKDNLTISNGIIWSLDQQTMYHIDTPTLTVQAYDYSFDTGDIANPRVVIRVPKEMGHPDGMTIDDEGMLWIALFGGGGVARWNPNTGQLLQKIEIPAPHVTSCAFGGENLETLYITTARHGLSDQQLTKYPHSGGVFAVKPGPRGIPSALFGSSTLSD